MSVPAFPLQWPVGWPRTPYQKQQRGGRFQSTYSTSLARLQREMRLLGATGLVISSNLPLRLDGFPRADVARRRIEDPGVALYFTRNGKQLVMARDAYESVYDNLHSLVLAVEHLRGLERHGGGQLMERAFEGFQALPAPAGAHKTWREIMRIPPNKMLTAAELKAQYRYMVKQMHPDSENGTDEAFKRLNDAYAQGRRELGFEEQAA